MIDPCEATIQRQLNKVHNQLTPIMHQASTELTHPPRNTQCAPSDCFLVLGLCMISQESHPRSHSNNHKTHAPGQARTHLTQPQPSEPKLPPQQFHALLPDLSICFSSFVHTTCPLSRSRPYLALDGIYHPLGAALASNSTLRDGCRSASGGGRTRGFHPLWPPVRWELAGRRREAPTL